MAFITSVQPVAITIPTGATSNTATISSVDTSKAVVFWGGFNDNHTSTVGNEVYPRIELTDATTVTAYRNSSSGSFTVTVYATIIEFTSSMISSIQAGTIAFSTVQTSNTATISTVDTSRSVVIYLGATTSTVGQTPTNMMVNIELTDATTVTAARNVASSASMVIGYMVVEFQAAVIQSVQKRSFTSATSSTVETDTISSVTAANTMLIYNGALSASTSWGNGQHWLTLTNATTVTLTRNGTATTSRTIKYTVLEFVSGVINSIQRGSITLNSTETSIDATISSVVTARTLGNYLGLRTSASALNAMFGSVQLFDATHVRSIRGDGANAMSTGYEAVEFSVGAASGTINLLTGKLGMPLVGKL